MIPTKIRFGRTQLPPPKMGARVKAVEVVHGRCKDDLLEPKLLNR